MYLSISEKYCQGLIREAGACGKKEKLELLKEEVDVDLKPGVAEARSAVFECCRA